MKRPSVCGSDISAPMLSDMICIQYHNWRPCWSPQAADGHKPSSDVTWQLIFEHSLWITIQEQGKLWVGKHGRQSYSVVKQNSLKETQEEHRKWKGSDLLTQLLSVKNNLFTFFAFSPSITKTSSHHHTFRKEGNSIKTVFVVPPLSALSIVHCLHCHCRKLLSCF